MGHYNSGEWLLYRQNRITPQKRLLMEKHLERCEVCLRTYLDTVSEQDEELAALLLRPEFNSRVMRAIWVKKQHLNRSRRSRLLVNYITAASITLALVAVGVFDTLTREAPGLLMETMSVTRTPGEAPGWPDRLLDATTELINKIWQSRED